MYKAFKRILRRKVAVTLGRMLENYSADIARKGLPSFANAPNNLNISLPRRIHGAEFMTVGNDVWIGPNSMLMAITNYPSAIMQPKTNQQNRQYFHPKIFIGDCVSATGGLQIAAMSNITVESHVMFATNINITDGLHGFEHTHEPYKYQSMFRIAPVTIKHGCWIGQNTVIMPGVTIGEMSIIGANSVVSRNIPPYSIAVGSPARVIKKWDEAAEKWLSL